MDNLHESLKSKLNDGPTHAPDMTAWSKISAVVSEPSGNTIPSSLWFLAGVLASLLLLGSYHLVSSMGHVQNESHVIYVTDTIYQWRESHKIDTLYLKPLATQSVSASDTDLFNDAFYAKHKKRFLNSYPDLKRTYEDQAFQALLQDNAEKKSETITINTDEFSLKLNPITHIAEDQNLPSFNNTLPFIDKLLLRELTLTYDPIILSGFDFDISKKKSLAQLMTPKTFSLKTLFGPAVIIDNLTNNSSAYSFGLEASTLFDNSLRGFVNGRRFIGTTSELKSDDDIPMIFPDVTIPIGAEITEVYFNHNITAFGLGFDYLHKPWKILRPYGGLSYSYARSTLTNIIFELLLNNEEFDLKIDDIRNSPMQYIGVRIGSDINISHSLDAYIQGQYDNNINKTETNIFSVSAGLLYHF